MPAALAPPTLGESRLVAASFADDVSTHRRCSLSTDLRALIQTPFVAVKPLSPLDDRFLVYRIHGTIAGQGRIHIEDPRYGVECTIDSALVCAVPRLVPLSKLILAFPEETYSLFKQFTGTELYEVLSEKMSLDVVREGDSIGARGRVLLCEPVEQGQLDASTVVTLVKDTQIYDETDSDDDELDLSSYLSAHQKQQKTFTVAPLTTKHTPSNSDDSEFVVYAKTEDLTPLGVFSGDLVEATLPQGPKLLKIQTFAEPNSYERNTLHVSPVWLLNNGSPTTLTLQRTTRTIETASSLTLARIASPATLSKQNLPCFLANLKVYFETAQRVVSVGDLIPITFDSLLARTLPQGYDGVLPLGNADSVAWFKVTEIDGSYESVGQYIVDPLVSKLNQFGVLKELAPALEKFDWMRYLGLPPLFEFEGGCAQELYKLLKSSLVKRGLRTTVLLTSLSRNTGKSFLIKHLTQRLGLHLVTIEAHDVVNLTSEAKTLGTIRGKLDKLVEQCQGLVIYFRHLDSLAPKPNEQGKPGMLASKLVSLIEEYTQQGAVIVASTVDADKLMDPVRSKFRFELDVGVPSEVERRKVFEYLLHTSRFRLRDDVSISSLALQSAGLTPRDLVSIVHSAQSMALDRIEDKADELGVDVSLLHLNNAPVLTPLDFEQAISDARNKFSDSIGAPRIPNVLWEDIGGLDTVKGEILDTIDMPLKHPELFASGVKKRSGILFYGPPGTGKTLLAKAIATNFSLNFFSVKGPELLNMYIGESEANVRKVFQRARDAKPCVVFFDELDSVAPKRGNQGDSGGVMDRIVSQLLAELDGMSGGDAGDGVFVVGATNRPDLLDEALLRPGRFDKMVYLGIADDHTKQQRILEALTRKFKLDDRVDLQRVAETCPFNFTGADFYALCSDSMLNAMTRVAGDVDKKIEEYNRHREDPVSTRWWFDNVATERDIEVLVTEQDFDKARRELNPSVSAEELEHYLRVRDNFEGGKQQQQQQQTQ